MSKEQPSPKAGKHSEKSGNERDSNIIVVPYPERKSGNEGALVLIDFGNGSYGNRLFHATMGEDGTNSTDGPPRPGVVPVRWWLNNEEDQAHRTSYDVCVEFSDGTKKCRYISDSMEHSLLTGKPKHILRGAVLTKKALVDNNSLQDSDRMVRYTWKDPKYGTVITEGLIGCCICANMREHPILGKESLHYAPKRFRYTIDLADEEVVPGRVHTHTAIQWEEWRHFGKAGN